MDTNTSFEKTKINENLTLSNRKYLRMDGIIDIISSSDTILHIKLKDTNITIIGKDIQIKKLDIQTGQLEMEGLVECIKYGKSGNIFKRIFK
jgi:hypothetical protein